MRSSAEEWKQETIMVGEKSYSTRVGGEKQELASEEKKAHSTRPEDAKREEVRGEEESSWAR